MLEVMDGRLIFTFADDQKIAVPNSWHQASLAVAKRLVLCIVEEEKVPAPSFEPADAESDPDSKAIGFALEDGYLRLHFSFLTKLFDDKLRDAEGGILVYRINERTKTSRLELVELNSQAGADLQPVAGTATNRDGRRKISVSPITVSISLEPRLNCCRTICYASGDQAPMKNQKIWVWFAENIELLRGYADKTE